VTLGANLERDLLAERAARLDRVVTALRARARAYDAAAVPPPHCRSLSDFGHASTHRRRSGASGPMPARTEQAPAGLRAAHLAAHAES
jgi:hypothetical protein